MLTSTTALVHCATNFVKIYQNFIDVNECLVANGGCMQSCINTAGSYYCTCGSGYTLNTDGHNCEGISIVFELLVAIHNVHG